MHFLRLKEWQWLALIFAAGILLRFFFLPPLPVQVDEHMVFEWIRNPGISYSEVYPPGFHFLLKALVQITGSILFTRIILALLLSPAILLVYWIARDFFGGRIGLVSAFFFAISPTAVIFSTHLRPYGLLTLVFLTTTFFLLRIVEQKAGKWEWTGLSVFYAWGFWSHYYAFLFLPVHLAVVFLKKKDNAVLGPLALGVAGALALFAPAVPLLWRQLPTAMGLFHAYYGSAGLQQIFFTVLSPFAFLLVPLPKAGFFAFPTVSFLAAIVWVLGIFLLGLGCRQALEKQKSLLVLAFGSFVLIACAFLLQKTLFWARYIVPALPFWLMLMAQGRETIQNPFIQKLLLALLAMGFLVLDAWIAVVFASGHFEWVYL